MVRTLSVNRAKNQLCAETSISCGQRFLATLDTGWQCGQRLLCSFHVPNVDATPTSLIVRSEREAGCPFGKPVLGRGHFFRMRDINDNGCTGHRQTIARSMLEITI